MDAFRVLLLSLLIGATVSSGPQGLDFDAPAAATGVPQLFITVPQATFALAPVTSMPTPQPTAPVFTLVTLAPTARATATQAPSSSGGINRELAQGSEGDDVRMLQRLLKDLGYKVEVDGTFGVNTRDAVKAFQKNNNLTADGIAGTRTVRKLSSDSAVRAGSANAQRTSLSYGMSGQDVKDLQARLALLGYYSDVVSGNYLTNTRAAVRWFQQRNGLYVDGIAGPATQARVYSADAVKADGQTPVGPTAAPSGFYRTLQEGASGADVTLLQQLLKGLGYFSGNTTDYFGANTRQAVMLFQRYNGLYEDGVAGTSTQQKLLRGDAVPYYPLLPTQTARPTLAPYQTPTPGPWGICDGCGQPFSSAAVGQHMQNTYCAHYLCVSGKHRACRYCFTPECAMPLICTSPLNPTGVCALE